MGVPLIVKEAGTLVLSCTLCKPAGDSDRGKWQGKNPFRIPVEYIRSPDIFVGEPLQVDRRNRFVARHRRLDLNNVQIFVRDDIPQPAMGSAKRGVESGDPDFNFVVEKEGGSVGVIFPVAQHNAYFFFGLMVIQPGDGAMDLLRNFGNDLCGTAASFLKVHKEVGAFDGVPGKVIFGVVVELRAYLGDGFAG